MALSIGYSLKILSQIKNINSIADYNERTDRFIFGRQQIQNEINDELDEIFQHVELFDGKSVTKKEKELKDLLLSKTLITTLSETLTQDELNQYEYNQLFEFMHNEIDKMYWFDKELLELYLGLGNFRAVSATTKIPLTTCFRTVQRFIEKIRVKGISKFNDMNIKNPSPCK